MEQTAKTPLGLLEEAGYRVEVVEEQDEASHQKRFHALAIDEAGEYRVASSTSQVEVLAELARQLGLDDAD